MSLIITIHHVSWRITPRLRLFKRHTEHVCVCTQAEHLLHQETSTVQRGHRYSQSKDVRRQAALLCQATWLRVMCVYALMIHYTHDSQAAALLCQATWLRFFWFLVVVSAKITQEFSNNRMHLPGEISVQKAAWTCVWTRNLLRQMRSCYCY